MILVNGAREKPGKRAFLDVERTREMRRQWATILDIIEAGLWSEPERVRAYTELLIERIQAEQDTQKEERERDVAALRRLLACRESGKRGSVILPAGAPDHADPEGRE